MGTVIVCVDDEQVVLDSIRSMLETEFKGKFSIEVASDGQEALELLQELEEENSKVHILITDWLMPKVKGDELISKTHELYPHMKKIMITGQADQNAIEKVKSLGGLNKLFLKPWDSREILNTLHEYLKEVK